MPKITEKIKAFLVWTQKYTKTDMLYLTKGGFWLSFGQFLSLAMSFALSLAFANLLPKEIYGTYKYILSLYGLLAIPSLAGMNVALSRSVARGLEGSVYQVQKTKISWSLLGSLAGFGAALFYYLHGNFTLMSGFLIAATFLPVMESFDIYSSILSGKKDFKRYSLYSIFPQIIASSILICSLFLTKNLFAIIFIYFLSWSSLRFIFYRLTLAKTPINKEKDPEVISYGKHLSFMGILSIIASYFDRLLVFHFWGAANLALYSIAIAPPEQIKGILTNIHNLAFPKFAKRKDEEIRSGIGHKFLVSAILGIVVVGAYITAAPFIFRIFFPKYLDAVFISQIFSLSLLNISFGPAETYLSAKKKVKELYVVNTVTPILQIGLMTAFTLWHGILGLVVARIISRYVGILLILILYYTSGKNPGTPEEIDQTQRVE